MGNVVDKKGTVETLIENLCENIEMVEVESLLGDEISDSSSQSLDEHKEIPFEGMETDGCNNEGPNK